MMLEKKVSVVMAVYNGALFLRKQLDSICNQTYKNLDVIALDDCSTDQSVDILKEYHETYGIHYQVNDKNIGYRKNFEKALTLCDGDYIAFADQDDIWLPEKIETMVREIGNYSLIYSDAKIIDEHDHIISDSFARYTKTGSLPKEEHQYKKAVFYWLALGCTMFFKRELLNELIPFADDGTAHDRQLSILATKKNKIKYIEKPLMLYRLHPHNTFGVAKGTFMREFSPRFLFPLEKEIERIRFYIETHNYPSQEDRLFLDDLLKYYQFKAKKRISFQAMRIAFRYRNIFFNDFNFYERVWLILGHVLLFDRIYRFIYKV